MKKLSVGLALASVIPVLKAEGFANAVLSYNPGIGFAPSYTNSTAALGEPSRVTPGNGGPVDPFNPPYLSDQVVSLGTGGSLTVQFDSPVRNDPANPYGIDFMIFGNTGFMIVNGDFSGGGITDGSTFGSNQDGETQVFISSDGLQYFQLDPAVTPIVDSLFPTDGSGDFHQAVNPALNNASFNGKGLSAIRALYGGSGGGTGFDISSARNVLGQPVSLDSIRFARVDVLRGASEIDGFSTVPEPTAWLLALLASPFLIWRRRK